MHGHRFDLSKATEEELLKYFRVSTRLDRAVDFVDFIEQVAPNIYLVQSASKPIRYTVDLPRHDMRMPKLDIPRIRERDRVQAHHGRLPGGPPEISG